MGRGGLAGDGDMGREQTGHRRQRIMCFQVFAKNRQFHLQNVKPSRVKSPWMAILGAIRQDAVWLRPVRIEHHSHILLVKSDFEGRLENT